MTDKERAELYKTLVSSLPGTWEDTVTPISQFRDSDLRLLTEHPGKRFKGDSAVEYEHARDQQCHAMAAHAWLSNPDWTLVYGFAAQESLCSADWHLHSFCLNEAGAVVEPTTLMRDYYWGVVLQDSQAIELVREEVGNIAQLGFVLSPEQLCRVRS